MSAASYTCPHCGAVSFNPNDQAHRYCGRCHRWGDDPSSPRGDPSPDLMRKVAFELARKQAEVAAALFGLTNVRGFERYATGWADWRDLGPLRDLPTIDGECIEIGGLIEGPDGETGQA